MMTTTRAIACSLALATTAPLQAQQAASTQGDDESLDEIVVTGLFEEIDRVVGSAHRVDAATLETFEYNDISRVLNLVPGVYSREEDGVGLRPNIGLRGGSADRSTKVAIMEDGVLLAPAPYSAPAAYFFPLSSRLVGVEVFKGPSSIQYGPQTIGGAINLVTAPIPRTTEGLLQVAGGSDGYRHLHARGGTQTEQFGVLAEFMHLGSDGFKQIDGGGDAGYDKNELMLKLGRDIGPGTIELRVTYADEVSNETYLGLTESDFRADPVRRYGASELDRMEWDWLALRADWEQPLFGGTLQATGYIQKFDRAWRKFNNFNGTDIRGILSNPDTPFNQLFVSILNGADTDGISGSPDDIRIGTNDREFDTSGIQGTLRWSFGDSVTHDLQVGARLHSDRIRSLHDEFGFEQIAGSVVENDQPRAITRDSTGYTRAFSAWIRDDIAIGQWRLVPGLRVEAIENSRTDRLVGRQQKDDYIIALPGLGAMYDVNEDLSLLAGVHKGFSPAVPSLNEDVDPEESINYELGGRWRSDWGRFELIGFYNDYSNLTAICTISSGCDPALLDTQINAGEVRTVGAEFGWNHLVQIGNRLSVPISLTYTYTEAEFREAFTSINPQFGVVEPGFEVPYIPPHRANFNIGLAGANWGTQLSVTYQARMRDQAGIGDFDTDEGSDQFTVIDLAANYAVTDRWTLSGRINNLSDEVYVVARRPFGARPGLPRTLQFEATYRY
ncbi:MAG: TonB-dependent receptor [Pseudomonadota bacterium]